MAAINPAPGLIAAMVVRRCGRSYGLSGCYRSGRDTPYPPIAVRMSAASSSTRASSVSQEHMKRAPPLPMKV